MTARRPWLAFGLAGAVLSASVSTGSLWHELPAHFAGRGSFGWPALEAGRWWTLASSLLLTRNTFMALTMALAVALGLGLYERRVGPGRALAVALVGHVTGSVVVAVSLQRRGAGAVLFAGLAAFFAVHLVVAHTLSEAEHLVALTTGAALGWRWTKAEARAPAAPPALHRRFMAFPAG